MRDIVAAIAFRAASTDENYDLRNNPLVPLAGNRLIP
jgi:hypothetical protein